MDNMINEECSLDNDGLTRYSQAEWHLIYHFGYADIAESLYPSSLYRMMIHKAFVTNDQSPEADLLRNAVIYMENGGYRGTEAFDSIICVE